MTLSVNRWTDAWFYVTFAFTKPNRRGWMPDGDAIPVHGISNIFRLIVYI